MLVRDAAVRRRVAVMLQKPVKAISTWHIRVSVSWPHLPFKWCAVMDAHEFGVDEPAIRVSGTEEAVLRLL